MSSDSVLNQTFYGSPGSHGRSQILIDVFVSSVIPDEPGENDGHFTILWGSFVSHSCKWARHFDLSENLGSRKMCRNFWGEVARLSLLWVYYRRSTAITHIEKIEKIYMSKCIKYIFSKTCIVHIQWNSVITNFKGPSKSVRYIRLFVISILNDGYHEGFKPTIVWKFVRCNRIFVITGFHYIYSYL